ncbi:hypothetical protein ERJ75_000587800 [Trypanosoma vivax]|nr:hypothetical protein ERJ75_000587800 [Trypanosoma vivax]
MAVARAWHGTQEAQVDQGGVKPGTDAIKKIAEAKKLSERDRTGGQIDALNYTAILGNISERPDTRENESNELFRTIAGGGTNTGLQTRKAGAALSNDMMWLCNVAGATGTIRNHLAQEG